MALTQFDHHIQSEIFAKLRASDTLRYKDLKDSSIESSQFVYHLNELIKRKLVEKVDKGLYALTPLGVMVAQNFSSDTRKVSLGVLTYTLVFLRSNKGRWLVVKRKKHPFYSMYACVSGKLHFNETLGAAAQRELREHTSGLIDCALTYKGYVSVMVKHGQQENHITGPVWFADSVEEVDLPELPNATPIWVSWQELSYTEFIPGWKEIIEMIEQDNQTFLDMHFDGNSTET